MALRCHSALLWTCAVTLIDPSGVSAGESSAHAPALTARSTLDESVRTLPVFYDSTMTAKGFPSPFLRVRIGEHEATFLVDSGASTHVFADWFVKAAGIPSLETDSTVQGSSGKSASERTVHQLHGAWSDGRSFNLDEAVVVSFPDFFESLHIGGLLSPQLLAAPGSAAVLNLKIPSFHFLPFAQAVSELRRSKSSKLTLDRTRACQNPTSHFKNREYVAPVSLGPVTDLMLVDTGATKTILSRESKLAQAIDMRSEPGGASESVGGEVDARRIVRDVQLVRGGAGVALDPAIGNVSAPCRAKGVLGMDALRGCVLVLGEEELALSCR
jgi:Aspartyl protease